MKYGISKHAHIFVIENMGVILIPKLLFREI